VFQRDEKRPASCAATPRFKGFLLNPKSNRQLNKYLHTRAVSSPWRIAGHDGADFTAAIVIPALAEKESLPKTLESLTTNPAESLERTLVLVVVNNRSDAEAEFRHDNQQTLDWLRSNPYPQLKLAWVDASSEAGELPAREGVGLARKIGFDLALNRLDWRQRPLLVSLDADTLVDANYLPAIYQHFQESSHAGATIPFRHQPGVTPEQETAIRRYELYLRSYLFGLQQAGSPYAYHTIGSAFACTAEAYIAAGGMNRRRAAEDFYFLQQLAKTGGVKILNGTRVQPSPRFSNRVPFGTGRAVQLQMVGVDSSLQFCPLEAFVVLRDWLKSVEQYWNQPGPRLLESAAGISETLVAFLEGLHFVEHWAKLQLNHPGEKQFLTAFHSWFDGLRTRQLLGHWAKNRNFSAELKLVGGLLNWGGIAVGEDLLTQLAALERPQLL